jgi:uncharacterized lipoprotein YmbA
MADAEKAAGRGAIFLPIDMRLRVTIASLAGFALAGCLNLRQVNDPVRFYVLTSTASPVRETAVAKAELAVGLARVDIPAYLLEQRMASRRGAAEIQYADNYQWAERLDKGIQRVLASNLSALLPTGRIMLSAWQRREVDAEVYLSVQRFESDPRGQAVLDARWRIASTGGGETLRTGHSHIMKTGPALSADPEGTAATLSQALADLSQEIASALQDISNAPPAATAESK